MTIESLATGILAADDRAVATLNAVVRTSRSARRLIGQGATSLAVVEVLLMGALAVGGRRGSAVRMLGAVAVVYLASEILGRRWPRQRPFARLRQVEALTVHAADRSFPSRHMASGVAMAVIGRQAHPWLGQAMVSVAGLLGVSRVAAGLHYPSDVLAGALLGHAVGRLLRSRLHTAS